RSNRRHHGLPRYRGRGRLLRLGSGAGLSTPAGATINFSHLATGDSVFVDANILTYHFEPHARWGAACTQLLQQIENQHFAGYTSSHVIGEVCHRLMTIEAHRSLGWQIGGIGNRLRTNPTEVRNLSLFRTAVEEVLQGRLHVLTVTAANLA